MVFHDSSLRDIVAKLPKTKKEFLNVLGVGESKADKYGKLFIEEIAAYLREHAIAKLDLPRTPYIPPIPGDTSLATLRLFRQGQSPAEIAASRGLSVSTVIIHLEAHIACGEITDISRLVPKDKIAPIKAAFEKYGNEILSPVMEALGKEKFTFDELRVVRAYLFAQRQQNVLLES